MIVFFVFFSKTLNSFTGCRRSSHLLSHGEKTQKQKKPFVYQITLFSTLDCKSKVVENSCKASEHGESVLAPPTISSECSFQTEICWEKKLFKVKGFFLKWLFDIKKKSLRRVPWSLNAEVFLRVCTCFKSRMIPASALSNVAHVYHRFMVRRCTHAEQNNPAAFLSLPPSSTRLSH